LLLPLQGEGWEGDGFGVESENHPLLNLPLEGEDFKAVKLND